MIDLSTLNSQQKKAVTTVTGPVLVIAGAGTGKTHVITTRIAYLINECAIAPQKILAITFTKKAAEEMANRVKKKIDTKSLRWICTYHGLCYRILKMEINHFGWDQKFTVIDVEEQITIIKNILKNENIALPSSLKPRSIVAKIKHIKKNIDGIVDDSYKNLGHLLGNVYHEQFAKTFIKIVTSVCIYRWECIFLYLWRSSIKYNVFIISEIAQRQFFNNHRFFTGIPEPEESDK